MLPCDFQNPIGQHPSTVEQGPASFPERFETYVQVAPEGLQVQMLTPASLGEQVACVVCPVRAHVHVSVQTGTEASACDWQPTGFAEIDAPFCAIEAHPGQSFAL